MTTAARPPAARPLAARPPAAGPTAEPRPCAGGPLRPTIGQARRIAEVSWGVAALLRAALGADARAWVSTTLRVEERLGTWFPDVAVGPDPAPLDGAAVPALVVDVGAGHMLRPAAAWRTAGVSTVWELSGHQILIHDARGVAAVTRGALAVPHPDAAARPVGVSVAALRAYAASVPRVRCAAASPR